MSRAKFTVAHLTGVLGVLLLVLVVLVVLLRGRRRRVERAHRLDEPARRDGVRRETFTPSTEHGGHDGDGRALRYLIWTSDPDPTDDSYVEDFVYVFREGDAPARAEAERHVFGLFSRETWRRLLVEAGFQVTVRPLEHSEVEPGSVEVFVAVKGDG